MTNKHSAPTPQSPTPHKPSNTGFSKEQKAFSLPGVPIVLVYLVLAALAAVLLLLTWIIPAIVIGLVLFFGMTGFFVVQPNQSSVMTLAGRYVGTERRNGIYWTNPFTSRLSVSLRIHNFNSERLKVNDKSGNPIEIAAVIVWRVIDTAKACFDVEDYQSFVTFQAETALRHLASQYPYDNYEEGEMSLRTNADEVSEALKLELAERLALAGIEIVDARLSHLAYSPEIAGAMLQRQQASAIISARKEIVQGAVGMVEMALNQLSDKNIVELDEDRKAHMVSNLLVVLTSERGTQPVVNASSD